MFPLRDSTPSQSFPFVTVILIIINLLIFMLEMAVSPQTLDYIVYYFGLVPASINQYASIANYYPLVTSLFLHGSWMHVLGNMWILWLFGDNVEDSMGAGRFLLFYILCGLAAGLTHYLINPWSNIPMVGASGAVAGVMGAYFVLFRRAQILTYIPPIFLLNLPAWIYLGIWAMLQLYCGAANIISPNSCDEIAFWAHVGGFITGMVLHKYFLRQTQEPG